MSVDEITKTLGLRPTLDDEAAARLIALRRDLHRHPELSGEERRTSRVVAERLRELGLEPLFLLETGLVADLPGPEGVPRVALRADLDALPIREETGLPFASVHDGVMHACGHDGHTTMLLGAAELLVGLERSGAGLPAPVRLLFQPAEETVVGARAMIDAGALDGVAMVFGVHLDPRYRTGGLIVTPGPVNASADQFTIRVRGQGAHAARAHEGVDAIVAGSALVMALQTIVAREVDPAHRAVVSVGRFEAGTAPNILAGEAWLEGTIRAQLPEVRRQLQDAVRRISASVAATHRAEAEVEIRLGPPPLINRDGPLELARAAAAEVVGEDAIEPMRLANLGGEDFAEYLEHAEGAFIRVAAGFPGREPAPAHSSRFDFDEGALAIGARYLATVALHAGRALATRSR